MNRLQLALIQLHLPTQPRLVQLRATQQRIHPRSLLQYLPSVIASMVLSTAMLALMGVRSVQAIGALDFSPARAEVTTVKPESDPPAAGHSEPAITFQPSTSVAPPVTMPPRRRSPTTAKRLPRQLDLFTGGADSVVSRIVGHAEGTRAVDGSKTRAYQGHVDPGNGVWNLGSFSFQHCQEAAYQCSTPEEADVHQLRRLQAQAAVLNNQASQLGMRLTTVEELNGIDLANQAPLAALDEQGYVALLHAAAAQGLSGAEAVLWARTYAYWNPNKNRWEAPGLGNTESSIRYDQNRRMEAIAAALDYYLQENSSM